MKQGDSMEKLAYTPKEVGELLGLGRSSTYEALQTKIIPSIRVGGKYLIPKAALDKLLTEVDGPELTGQGV
jgi:excisionase family DNA binding protein